MNLEDILKELRQQSDRIANAMSALLDQRPPHRGTGRPADSKNPMAARKPKRRTMSASARAKISAAQKARWAKQKKSKGAARKKSKPRRTMSPAARKKLSVLMKARWAAEKNAA
jgi:hypothetical protein